MLGDTMFATEKLLPVNVLALPKFLRLKVQLAFRVFPSILPSDLPKPGGCPSVQFLPLVG